MDTESHITIYETLGPNPANNKKNIFIYNVSNSSIHYDVNEIESLKGNYKICMKELRHAICLYYKASIIAKSINTENVLKLIYIIYWLENYRVKEQYYLKVLNAGIHLGKTKRTFISIMSQLLLKHIPDIGNYNIEPLSYDSYNKFLNSIYDRALFEINDFIPCKLLHKLIFRHSFTNNTTNYSNDVALSDIISIDESSMKTYYILPSTHGKLEDHINTFVKKYINNESIQDYLSVYFENNDEEIILKKQTPCYGVQQKASCDKQLRSGKSY
jgi:hypothetical protein